MPKWLALSWDSLERSMQSFRQRTYCIHQLAMCISFKKSANYHLSISYRIPGSELSMSPIHLSAVDCDGTENSILGCSHSTSTQNFNNSYDAYIVCRPNDISYSGRLVYINA